jgi:hypothetical protein
MSLQLLLLGAAGNAADRMRAPVWANSRQRARTGECGLELALA